MPKLPPPPPAIPSSVARPPSAARLAAPLHSLDAALRSIHDSRDARGRRHPLHALLGLIVVGLACGCQSVEGIEAFGAANPDLLRDLGFRPTAKPRRAERRGAIVPPSNDTLVRCAALVGARRLNEALAAWLSDLALEGAAASVDGKALGGSGEGLLSLFVGELNMAVWQEPLGAKASELKTLERTLPTLLARFENLKLFTLDAGFCHKTVARALVDAKRDYLMQLKSPHGTDLRQAREALSAAARAGKPLARSVEKRGPRAARP